ncbi:MAG: class I SAM-dependent methyltransferase [Eubacteriales bacterium]|nr:class I SAM-dependent methyltransferase [Eubacteriales bacterium]
MFVLNDDMRDFVKKKIGFKSGLRVLDVGCGSGEFIWYLAKDSSGVDFTGLDYDESFVEAATKRIPGEHECSFSFVQGDAKEMPFPDECFDLVVSHTFFNSMPQYKEALSEMIRVCKPGGIIASVSSMDVAHIPYFKGIYPESANAWKKEYDMLLEKVQKMYEKVTPIQGLLQGIATELIPAFFARNGLDEVSAYPIGRFFSLSNSATPQDKKKRYIELDYISEKKRVECVYELDEAKECMSGEEVKRFIELLEVRRDYLLKNINENRTWELQGGVSLLVTGRRLSRDQAFLHGILNSGLFGVK